MFQELERGATKFDPAAELKARIEELVRDLTKVGSIPKSEATRRIMELIETRPNKCYKCGRGMDDICFRCEVED
jgi:polyhydroxyalkanoate synthesis regulator phasin